MPPLFARTPRQPDASRGSSAAIATLLGDHLQLKRPRLRRLWDYYRNPARSGRPDAAVGGHALAQADGLPARLRSVPGREREVVIENDIAWRVDTIVDFMFGKPPTIRSLAPDPKRAAALSGFLRAVFEASGGSGLLQDTALLGTVYGHVDLLLNLQPIPSANRVDPSHCAASFRIEPVDAQRGVPVVAQDDYRALLGYLVLHTDAMTGRSPRPGILRRIGGAIQGDGAASNLGGITHWAADTVSVYRQGRRGEPLRLVQTQRNALGRVPIIHIQNLPQPLMYEGLSEVEPLIPLQDELNTRLSDRANRVTFQAFKMYLGKGIEQFTERPIAPGQMWHTDNADASIQEFGGDSASPSEDTHIGEVRDALDKTSGVSPVAAGVLRGKVGNLTSQNAVRLVLMGLLARVERKRLTYGGGLERMCELVLHAADVHGVLPNTPDERRVRIDWPDPVPENRQEQLDIAERKIALGVPRQTVLNELGYGECGAA
ncbi:MAG: phage portal protein [Phycisphaerales bacterium JB063]